MSQTQDVFGSAPKSVLNKPLFHAQDRKPAGEGGGSAINGENIRTLNTVLINEIPGASLSGNNTVNLPAGEYYIQGKAPAHRCSSSRGLHLMIAVDGVNTLVSSPLFSYFSDTEIMTSIENTVEGKIVLNAPAAITLVHQLQTEHSSGNGLGVASSTLVPFTTFADIKVWKLDSNVETQIADPTMVLARPLLHVQQVEPNGTGGGSSAANTNVLVPANTVHTNEIASASLNGDGSVSLPAGTYYFEGDIATTQIAGAVSFLQIRKSPIETSDSIRGTNIVNRDAEVEANTCSVSGTLTLTETTDIGMFLWTDATANTTGLGNPSPSVNSGDEYYGQMRIWSLTEVKKCPGQEVYEELASNPNMIINGDMRIWQRGESFSGSNIYTADRWYNARVALDVAKDTDTNIYKNFIKLTNDGTTDTSDVRQPVEIESDTLPVPFEPGQYTLSFRVRCSVANKSPWVYLAWRVGTSGTAEVMQVGFLPEVLPANTWVDVEFTVTPSAFAIPAGATCLLVGVGAGESGVNFSNGDEVHITDVKLEKGDTVTQFVPRTTGEELALCERYWQEISTYFLAGNSTTTTSHYLELTFKGTMRVPATWSTPTVLSTLNVQNGGTQHACTNLSVSGNYTDRIILRTTTATTNQRRACTLRNWQTHVLDAEL